MFSAKVTLKFQDSMTGVTGGLQFNHGFKRFRLRSTRKTKVEWGLVSLAHNLRKYVAYKAKSKHKQAQSMALVAEKPAMKSAV